MKNKKAYLVLGAESSCTRFITKCLVDAGCVGRTGHNDHEQEIDFKDPTEDCIVWRRSYPHAWGRSNKYPYVLPNTIGIPDTDKMYNKLKSLDYKIVVVVTTRDWFATSMSGVTKKTRPHSNTMNKAYDNTKNSYKKIFNFINKYDLEYVMMNYESLILYGKEYMNQMLKLINLKELKKLDFKDSNKKYYKRGNK